jgi:hypothetical protein
MNPEEPFLRLSISLFNVLTISWLFFPETSFHKFSACDSRVSRVLNKTVNIAIRKRMLVILFISHKMIANISFIKYYLLLKITNAMHTELAIFTLLLVQHKIKKYNQNWLEIFT